MNLTLSNKDLIVIKPEHGRLLIVLLTLTFGCHFSTGVEATFQFKTEDYAERCLRDYIDSASKPDVTKVFGEKSSYRKDPDISARILMSRTGNLISINLLTHHTRGQDRYAQETARENIKVYSYYSSCSGLEDITCTKIDGLFKNIVPCDMEDLHNIAK